MTRKYYLENREHAILKSRQWSKDNPERKRETNRLYRLQNREIYLLKAAKTRATTANLPFEIELCDIIIPEYCPILGVKLTCGIGKGRGNIHRKYSPSIDRIDSSKGYTKDNIQIISWLANTMKSMATQEELILFANGILKQMESRYAN